MKPEMSSLVLISTFTGLLWIPYVLNRIAVRGVVSTVGYPVDPPPLSPWAQRLRAAHANAVENLVVFAALVLAAQVFDISTPVTALAGSLYLWSRVTHAIVYTLGVPWLRTLAFTGGFVAQMLVAWQLLEA
jgi:MAPEG family protein